MGVSLNLNIPVLFYTNGHMHTHTLTGCTNCLSFHEVRDIFIYYTEKREHYLAEEV